MKITALVNPDAGSVPKSGETQLAEALEELGVDYTCLAARGAEFAELAQQAARDKADVLIVWGGDGSVACVLNSLGDDGPPVLALPGGTMNLLHRRLHHGLTDWRKVLDLALRDPKAESIACGEVEGHRFYVAAMFGKLTGLHASREALRNGEVITAARSIAETGALELETRLIMTVHHQGESHTIEAVAGAVAIAETGPPRLEAAGIDPGNIGDFLSIGLDVLFNGWRESETVETDLSAREVRLSDASGAEIPSTIDGEPVMLPPQCTVRLIKNAARVLRARPDS